MAVPAVHTRDGLARPEGRAGTSFPWLQAAVLVAVATLFAAMLVEIGLRVADLRATNLAGLQCVGSGTQLQGQKGLYGLDSMAGFSMRPDTCVRLKTVEYDGVLRTNGRAMVGPTVSATKAADEFRIVVLGDSYTVGGQVGVTWGLTAARMVDDSGTWFPRNGLSGAPPAPWDAARGLPEPVGNQPPNAMMALPPAQSTGIRSTARAVWDMLRSNSLLLGKLFGVPVDPSVSTAPGAAPLAVEQQRLNLTSFEWAVLRDIPHTYWLDVAWPLFGRYLAEARDTASSVGAPLVVLSIPDMSQFDDQIRARTMANYRFQDSEVDWSRPQRDLLAQTQEVGVPMLDLLPQFSAMPDRANLYLRIDTHFSAYGHQVTADSLSKFLQDGGYLRWLSGGYASP